MSDNPNDRIPGEAPRRAGWRVMDLFRGLFTSGTPVMPVNVTVPEQTKRVLRRVVKRAQDPVIRSRTREVKDRLEIYDNQIKPQLLVHLKSAFHPENYERLYWVLHSSSNVMRRIINETSVLYENPAKRRLKEDDKKTQTSEDSLDEQKAAADGEDGEADPLAEKDKKEEPPKTDGDAADRESAADGKQDEDKPERGKKPFPPKKAAPAPAKAEKPDGKPEDIGTGEPDIDQLAVDLELSGSSDEEDGPFEKLMKAYDLDTLMDQVEKLCMICPVVWVRPMVVYDLDANGKPDPTKPTFNYVIYTPDCADVEVDPANPTNAIAFWYWGEEYNEKGDVVQVVHLFTKQQYMKFDSEWRPIGVPQVNVLGRLPVAAFRLQTPRAGYFNDGVGRDLHEATIELNALKTLQNQRLKDGAFKQLAIQGDSKELDQDIIMGGPAPLLLGDENTASVLDLTPNLEQMTSTWEKRETSLAATHGINIASYKAEGHPESGFAKKLDQDKVLKESRRRRKVFAKGEQDLYTLSAVTLDKYPIATIGKPPIDGVLEVDYAEPTFEEEPQTQARTDAIELKYNVVSIIDILRRRNPDLTDIELIKQAYKNKRINDAFMTSDQMNLTDLLATRANVGGSFGRVGANGQQDPNAEGDDDGSQGQQGKPGGKGGGFPPAR